MPQMKPMLWLLIALMCYSIYLIMLFKLNFTPSNSKYLHQHSNKLKTMEWKW